VLPADRLVESAFNVCAMHLLERVARRFAAAGVPLMVLKGAALHLTLYQKPEQRPMGDLDLLVRVEDAQRACALLAELGGQPGEPLVREDFFPRFYYEREYSIGEITPVKIDLHVRPFRPLRYARLVPDDALWRRARRVPIGGSAVHVPGVEEMLIHLVVHAAVHGSARKMWLRDIKRWADAHRGRLDWDRFCELVDGWRLGWPALQGLVAAARESGAICPAGVLERLRRSRVSWRDRLALWHAPRDTERPAVHVLVNAACTPGLWFTLNYLWAVLIPGAAHMRDWYGRRHVGWLLSAHVLRLIWPLVKYARPLWSRFSRVEVRACSVHGKRVFAVQDLDEGEVASRSAGLLRFVKPGSRPNARWSGRELVILRPVRAGQEIRISHEAARALS
jgi:hypothetical protein